MAAISQANRLPGAWHRGESLRTQVMQEAGLELSKSTFSHHLRIVREADSVTRRIQGAKGYARLRKDDVDRRFPGPARFHLYRRRRDQASLTTSRTGPRLPSCPPNEPWCPAPLLRSPPYLWVPGQCRAAALRAASSARPAASQAT